jgi:A/G-specific adenine glycosylase
MELGATVCTPKAPQCLLCPVAKVCEARRLGEAETFPEKRKKRASVEIVLAAAVFCDARGQTLLLPPPARDQAKPAADHMPTLVSGMWHFPTVATRKDGWSSLRKFLELELGTSIAEAQAERLKPVRHAVTYRSIRAVPFRIRVAKLPRVAGAKSVALEEVSTLPVSNLTRKIARAAVDQPVSASLELVS